MRIRQGDLLVVMAPQFNSTSDDAHVYQPNDPTLVADPQPWALQAYGPLGTGLAIRPLSPVEEVMFKELHTTYPYGGKLWIVQVSGNPSVVAEDQVAARFAATEVDLGWLGFLGIPWGDSPQLLPPIASSGT